MDNCFSEFDCAVCLQKCHHPTKLPCGHIFCFLCVKGVAIQSRKCAMCRAEIPSDYLDHPVLLEKLSSKSTPDENVGYQWYYEGRNGWWRYDERSNEELERAYTAGESETTLLLAGSLYIINFDNMLQMRRHNQARRRCVKRDTPSFPAKGIAGIKIFETEQSDIKTELLQNGDSSNNSSNTANSSDATDESTQNVEHQEDHTVDIVEVLSSLRLNAHEGNP